MNRAVLTNSLLALGQFIIAAGHLAKGNELWFIPFLGGFACTFFASMCWKDAK